MLEKIKIRIDTELKKFVQEINKIYSLNKISPLLFQCLKDFILRKGKRIRPILFIISYLGFSKRIAPKLYLSALSTELLHDFMLVHDDIIDKSSQRRGKLSMHKMLDKHLSGYKKIKFNGADLGIVIGDVMYAIAIKAFLSVKENMYYKEKALKKFIEAAIYTGSGEFIELLNGAQNIEKISKEKIYQIYDYKTAHYTFSTPLAIGAILAGVDDKEIDRLSKSGIYLGRAFQIKDDILGIFGDEKKIGKSILSDLQEAKKTLFIWYAYSHSKKTDKDLIRKVFAKQKVTYSDLVKIRKVIKKSGALNYAKKEISLLIRKSQELIKLSKMKIKYKELLLSYINQILNT